MCTKIANNKVNFIPIVVFNIFMNIIEFVMDMVKMLVKVWMPSLVNIMSTHRWKELNVVEGSVSNYSCPTWKPTFCAMAAKVLQIASWVLMGLLPWTQRKRWIPIGSMGCVHTHQGMLVIEEWGSPSGIWSDVQRIGEDNWKVGRTSQVIN